MDEYIYVLEDMAGNTEQVKRDEVLKRFEAGHRFRIHVYRIWRVYGEMDGKKPEPTEYEPVTTIGKLCKVFERKPA